MSIWSTSTRHLNQQANQLYNDISRLQQEIRQEEQRQEEVRRRAQEQQEYHRAYDTFAFMLSRDSREARRFLETLYLRYPEHLRRDNRLEGDMRRLLSVETGAFESRLRSRLGLLL